MKKLLFTVLIVALIVGCSKDDNPEELLTADGFKIEELFKEYNLLNKFDNIEKVSIGRYDDIYISFSGKLKNSDKIGVVVSDTITKKKLVDFVPFDNNNLSFDLPYGEKKSVTVKELYVEIYSPNGDGNAVLSILVNPLEEMTIPRYYCFIKDNKLVNKIGTLVYDPKYTEKASIIKWRENFLIILPYTYSDYSPLCNSSGEIIEKLKVTSADRLIKLLENLSQDEIINDYEAIALLSGSPFCTLCRMDLRKLHHDSFDYNNMMWYTEIDLSKLDRPQFNNKKILERTENHLTYELSYTEYSGNKITIKFKVNIETGEIEYL